MNQRTLDDRYELISENKLISVSRALFERWALPVFMELTVDEDTSALRHSWFWWWNFIHHKNNDKDILFKDVANDIMIDPYSSDNDLSITLDKYFQIDLAETAVLYERLQNMWNTWRQESPIYLKSRDGRTYSFVFVRRSDYVFQATLKDETLNITNNQADKLQLFDDAWKILQYIENFNWTILALSSALRQQLDSGSLYDTDIFFEPKKSVSLLRPASPEIWNNYLRIARSWWLELEVKKNEKMNTFFDNAVISCFIAPEWLSSKIISISKWTWIAAKRVYDSYKDFVWNMWLGLDDQWAHRLQSFLEDPELNLCRIPVGQDVYSVICAPALTQNWIQTTMTKLEASKDIYFALQAVLSQKFVEDIWNENTSELESVIASLKFLLNWIIDEPLF